MLYIVDYENVQQSGLGGIKKLKNTDTVIIAYPEMHENVINNYKNSIKPADIPAAIHFVEHRQNGIKNALDFKLLSFAAIQVAMGCDAITFVTNDGGFHAIVDMFVEFARCYDTRSLPQKLYIGFTPNLSTTQVVYIIEDFRAATRYDLKIKTDKLFALDGSGMKQVEGTVFFEAADTYVATDAKYSRYVANPAPPKKQTTVERLLDEFTAASNRAAELKQECDSLKEAVAKAEADLQTYKRYFTEAQHECDFRFNENSKLQAALSMANKRIHELEGACEETGVDCSDGSDLFAAFDDKSLGNEAAIIEYSSGIFVPQDDDIDADDFIPYEETLVDIPTDLAETDEDILCEPVPDDLSEEDIPCEPVTDEDILCEPVPDDLSEEDIPCEPVPGEETDDDSLGLFSAFSTDENSLFTNQGISAEEVDAIFNSANATSDNITQPSQSASEEDIVPSNTLASASAVNA